MPFYQYNSLTGRLQQSLNLQPLLPISSHKLETFYSSKMVWDSIKTKPVKIISPSSISFSTIPTKLIANFKIFQTNVEKPVYLLRGAPDKFIFGITCVSIVAGFVGTCFKLYEMAHPIKN